MASQYPNPARRAAPMRSPVLRLSEGRQNCLMAQLRTNHLRLSPMLGVTYSPRSCLASARNTPLSPTQRLCLVHPRHPSPNPRSGPSADRDFATPCHTSNLTRVPCTRPIVFHMGFLLPKKRGPEITLMARSLSPRCKFLKFLWSIIVLFPNFSTLVAVDGLKTRSQAR